jgi:hypothetical protein
VIDPHHKFLGLSGMGTCPDKNAPLGALFNALSMADFVHGEPA